ncbi:MAG: LamG domain-containing protein [Planctomycetota bacterium]
MTMRYNAERTRRSRGAAMLLVLIALAMCTILALSFLAAQEPTAVVASNIDRKTQARAIAESALKMAIDYVNEDADWRTDKSSGLWMSSIALDGGTFTLTGTDEADGDLADDSSEPVLLTVVANYSGVTHRVSALVTPGSADSSGNRLMFVVSSDSSPASQDQAKRTLFESWGYVVTYVDDSDSQTVYDAAVAVNDVVYVSESVSSSSVNTKLRGTTLGVVNDEGYLQDEFGFTTSSSSSEDTTTAIEIIDNSHPVTSGFSTGSLTILSSSDDIKYASSTVASGVTTLADRNGSNSNSVLMVAEAGDTLHYGVAAGRRVMFGFDDNLDVNDLNSDGQTLLKNAVDWAAGGSTSTPSGVEPNLIALYEFNQVTVAPTLAGRWPLDETGPGYAGAVQVIDNINLSNGGYIDAYDASAGAYGGTNQQLSARIFTNTTTSGDVSIDNGTVFGDVIVGAGGNPSSVIDTSNGGSISGSTSAQSQNAPVPTYDEPSGSFGSDQGSQTFDGTGDSETWSSNKLFDDLTIEGNAVITISGNVEVHIEDDFEIDNGDIVLQSGASLVIYIGGEMKMSNTATINNDTTRPGDLQIIMYGNSNDDEIEMDNATIVGSVHSADDVFLYNGSSVYGSITMEDDLTIDNSAFHAERSTSPPDAVNSTPAVAADSSSLGNDGTVNGDITAGVAGQHGTAFEFDGSSDYVEIPHNDSYLMQGGTFSVWFKTDKTSGRQGLFSKDSTSFDTGGHFSVFIDGSRIEVRMQSTTQSYYVYSPSSSISTDQWYHIMFAWGEEGMALYLDGVLVDSNSYTGGLGTTSGGVGNYEPIVLGGNAWVSGDLVATPVQDFFDGTLDDLRIYNERLDESQALEIYGGAVEPSPIASKSIIEDTSGFGDPLTLSVTETDDVSWATNALTFTGNTQATSLLPATKLHDAIEANGAFALEVILIRATPGGTSSPSRIVSYADGSSSHNFMLGQDGSKYEARVRDSSTGNNGALSPEFVSSTDLSSSGDTHVVLSYNEGEVSVFIDGVLDETNTAGGTLNNWSDAHYLVFGGAYGGGSHWLGTLKRVAIYDNAFNAIQANNVYNGSAPGTGESGVTGTGSVIWDEED